MKEEVVGVVEKTGSLSFAKTFEQPVEVVALWLSIDGDDTGSEYQVDIESIQITSSK